MARTLQGFSLVSETVAQSVSSRETLLIGMVYASSNRILDTTRAADVILLSVVFIIKCYTERTIDGTFLAREL